MTKKGIVLLNVLAFVLFAFYAKATEVFFTPSFACENQIISYIDSAKESVDAAIYAINNDAIVDALMRAHTRGVRIRILTDRTQAGQKSSKVSALEAFGIPLRRHKRYRIQHDKFAIFDGKKAVTGSYNWTNSASRKNAENCLFLNRKNKIVQEYKERFEFLWQLNDDNPVETQDKKPNSNPG